MAHNKENVHHLALLFQVSRLAHSKTAPDVLACEEAYYMKALNTFDQGQVYV